MSLRTACAALLAASALWAGNLASAWGEDAPQPAAKKPAAETPKPGDAKPADSKPAPTKPAAPTPAADPEAEDNGAGALEKAREALRKRQQEEAQQKAAPPPQARPLPGQLQMRGLQFNGRVRVGINRTAEAGEDEPVFFPADRATLQRLSKAQELLEEKRFGEAARLLGDILEGPEDFFFQPKRDEPIHRSLKAEAQRLIGELPSEGRTSYELLYGATARQQLDAAVAKGDPAALAEVSRRFFHTKAGYEATYVLALQQLDRGHPMTAALSLKRLYGTPGAAQFEPTLSIQLAACWLQAGMNDKAQETLRNLPAQVRTAKVMVGGKAIPLFHRDDEALSWLAQVAGARLSTQVDDGEQWAMFRGSASRNTISNGSSPLLSRRWGVPTADENGGAIEGMVSQVRESSQDQGGTLLCSLQPIAVKDYVFMRSIGGLVAINFATGKRVWRGPVDPSIRQLLDPGAATNTNMNQIGRLGNGRMIVNAAISVGPRWLGHRLWEDSTFGAISSDGQRVFCVEDLDAGMNLPEQRLVVLPNGRKVPQPMGPRSFNRLAAYDIATEGKLTWEAGGPQSEAQSELAGAFFLGAPLPLGDKVFALTELKGEIRLAAIDAKTGKLEWSQQLAVIENWGAEQLRRTTGLSPSYSDGVLVCPTSSGAVVALDLTTRSLLWGYQYTRTDMNSPDVARLGMIRNPAIGPHNPNGNGRWMDASVTIAGGKVLLTPPESNQLHCLNLLDGKPIWQKPREDGLYIGCVHDDRVLVIGRNSVRDLSLSDGLSAWPEQNLPLPTGSVPSGRGFFNGRRYHLPLTTAEVAAIDVDAGRIVARAKSRSGTIPGNLICHRGAVISQNIDVIERFDQRDDLWQQITAAVAANPNDASALARRGELLLDDGDFRGATDSLRLSFAVNPDPRTRDLLVDSLLEGMRVDFPQDRQQLADIERLIDQTAQRNAFLRLAALGWQACGNVPEAFAAYSRMAQLEGGADDLERVDHALSVRRDRWVQARLRELSETATASERNEMDREVAARLERAVQAAGSAPLRNFLAFYGALPNADIAREKLANRLIEEEAYAEAEQLLRQLELSTDIPRAAAATARYAALLTTVKRPDDAALYYRRLADRFADVECLDGKTGRQLVSEIAETADVRRFLEPGDPWPIGVVEREDGKAAPGVLTRHFALELSGPLGPFYEFSNLCIDQQQQSLVGVDGLGHERWRVPLRDPNQAGMNATFFGNGQMNPARVNGHVVLVSMGNQILAIDSLGSGNNDGARVLWRHDLIDRSPTMAFQAQPLIVQVPWAVPRLVVADHLGRPLGGIGPVTSDMACYQRMRSVIAVRPLTGESLWVRSDTEPGSDLFGDDEMLFIVPPNSEDALVVRPLDGKELGRRKVPASSGRMVTLGRRIASWAIENGKSIVKFSDPWEEKEIWRREFTTNARAWVVGTEAIGVMTPNGSFVLLSLADGKPLIEEKLSPEPNLSEIYVLRSPDRYIVAASHPILPGRANINRQSLTAGIGNPLISGHVYVFDRQSGKKIGSLAVDRRGLLLSQPSALPVLTFATLVTDNARKNRQQPTEAELVFLDKRTGKVVHQEVLPQPIQQGLDIEGDPEHHQVFLKTQGATIRLTFTGKPVPEEPNPENTSTDSDARKAGRAVLRGLQNWFESVTPLQTPLNPRDE
jgi:outer membrane protein assembly factor BamB